MTQTLGSEMSEARDTGTALLLSSVGHVPSDPHWQPAGAFLCTEIRLRELGTQQRSPEETFKGK